MKYKYRKDITHNGHRYSIRANTQRELYEKIAAKIAELEASDFVPATSNTTLREYALQLFETYKKPAVAEGTYKRYLNRLENCVLAPLGEYKLQELTRSHLQQAVNLQAGRSAYQISQTIQYIKFIFKQAEIDGIIARSPANGLVKPKGKSNERRSMTSKEEQAFLQIACSDPRYNVFLLSYYCGCRPDEARKVLGGDITLINNQPMLHIRGTKSAAAVRTVPVPSALYDIIKGTKKTALVAVNTVGATYDDKAYQRAWKHLKREMNILLGAKLYRNQLIGELPVGEDLVPYCLRHTYCTNLQKRGVDIRTAQYLMGHSSIIMTSNIYTHIGESQLKEAARLINKPKTRKRVRHIVRHKHR